MTTLRSLLERRTALKTELQGILAQHPDDLPGEVQQQWDRLKGEADTLESRIQRQSVVDDLERRAAATPVAGTGDRDLDREMRSFSLLRAIASQVPGLNVDAGREKELSTEIARRSGRHFEGMAIPMACFQQPVEQRVMTTALPIGGPGSNIIPTDYRPDMYIDLIRSALVMGKLGATTLTGLRGNLAIPAQTQSATATWFAENTVIPMSDLAWGQKSATPRHVGARVEWSRNLLLQTSPDIEQLVRRDLAAVIAGAVDRGAIVGAGGVEPVGVMTATGTASVSSGTNGGAVTWSTVLDLIAAVEANNIEGNAFLSNGHVVRAARGALKATGLPGYIMEDVGTLAGYPLAVTSNVPANLSKGTSSGNLSALIFGRWSDLMVCLWGDAVDLLVNPFESTAYSKGNVQCRAIATVDVVTRRPEAFAIARDIT